MAYNIADGGGVATFSQRQPVLFALTIVVAVFFLLFGLLVVWLTAMFGLETARGLVHGASVTDSPYKETALIFAGLFIALLSLTTLAGLLYVSLKPRALAPAPVVAPAAPEPEPAPEPQDRPAKAAPAKMTKAKKRKKADKAAGKGKRKKNDRKMKKNKKRKK